MFRWHHSEKVATQAQAQQVWAIWKDVEHWPAWDREVSCMVIFPKEAQAG